MDGGHGDGTRRCAIDVFLHGFMIFTLYPIPHGHMRGTDLLVTREQQCHAYRRQRRQQRENYSKGDELAEQQQHLFKRKEL